MRRARSSNGRSRRAFDTALFGDMKFYGEKYKPDLLLIPSAATT
ncbi:hypothetical protein [Enhydrobacter sp.]|jgi:hypothetical protein|nr:hypothetical protein [Enhydrobacter sp.]